MIGPLPVAAVNEGQKMYSLAQELWPLDRSISGAGVRATLDILAREIPQLARKNFDSGLSVFDWVVPPEWHVREAYIEKPDGTRFCDFALNNLHLVGYSIPFAGYLGLEELNLHLHSLPNKPTAIPYVTSYYEQNWGFCLTEIERRELAPGDYRVVVDTVLEAGSLDYAEAYFPGAVDQEVLFSTYICHPSMANNELSGPVLSVSLARYVAALPRHFSYRFLFLPETIGAVAYIHNNLEKLKSNVIAGYVLTCVGDEREFSYIPSRRGDSLADRMGLKVLEQMRISPTRYTWRDRGSDERQYCSPGIDLPVCSIIRSKYGEYPEYHTSLDRLGTVVTSKGLQQSFDYYANLISFFENSRFPEARFLCEPQLGKRQLKPNLSGKGAQETHEGLMDVLSYCDGSHSVEEIAALAGLDDRQAEEILSILVGHDLLKYR